MHKSIYLFIFTLNIHAARTDFPKGYSEANMYINIYIYICEYVTYVYIYIQYTVYIKIIAFGNKDEVLKVNAYIDSRGQTTKNQFKILL